MAQSVESLCNLLAKNRLLEPDEIRNLRQRWLQSARTDSADVAQFVRWLISNKTLTDYQAGVIERGNVEQLYIGPYLIQERIGKGRFAGVYRARHQTGITVAIKVLPPSKARDPQILGRFQREARLALKLKHPNVVRTFQAGVANGLHYLVMEHLEGEELGDVLARRGKLEPAEAVRLVHQVLLGLEDIHDKGLIHRDIKPANLMLVGARPETTLRGTVKIMDIGTGRALFDEGPTSELTNEGDILGTPQYMSPEQARDPRTADIRADIYSAGCVLYHLLAGRPPFVDANPVRLMVKVATEEPKPVRDFNPAVPDGLQQILNWMLAKDPAKRYPTPARAAQALQVFLSAGAEAPPQYDSEMNAYLVWLAGEGEDEEINVEPAEPAGALPTAQILEQPRPAPRVQPVVPVAPPVAPRPSVPVAQPVAPRQPAQPAPRQPNRPAPPPVPPAPPLPRPASKRPRDEEEEEEPATLFGLSRRDFFMLLAGVLGLAVIASLGLAIFAILRFGRRKDDEEKPEGEE